MALPGALLFLSFVALQFFFTRRLLAMTALASNSHNAAAALSAVLVSLAGGMSGFAAVLRDGVGAVLSGGADPMHSPAGGEWLGFIADVMLPDRGATFAYPTFVLVLLLALVAVRSRHVASAVDVAHIIMFAGGLMATLPLFEVRSCCCRRRCCCCCCCCTCVVPAVTSWV
jgi:hypothetical protein